MSARRNPFSKIQSLFEEIMGRIIALGPGNLQPADIAVKLSNAMEDNLQVQVGGIKLAPNYYTIELNKEDYDKICMNKEGNIADWERSLVELARLRRYMLRTTPRIKLVKNDDIPRKVVHVTAELADREHLQSGGGENVVEGTRMFNAQDVARMQAQFGQSGGMGMGTTAPPQDAFSFPGSGFNRGAGAPFAPPSVPPVPGLPSAWLIISLPQGGQQVYRIEKARIDIGRQRSNDIIVEDKRVSRQHAQILYQNGQFTIVDLNSVNGITINNVPKMRHHTLRSGDRFIIGSYEFQFGQNPTS